MMTITVKISEIKSVSLENIEDNKIQFLILMLI